MKKVLFSAIMLIGLAFSTQAQEFSKNALGLRLGSSNGFGTEISYQRGLSSNNRLEIDLGWRSDNDNVDNFKVVGLYQWVWGIEKGLNWYAGAGAGLGSWNYDQNGYSDSGMILLLAGDIGIEYNFDIPLQIAIDFRPELYLDSDSYREDNFGGDVALSLRYRF
jgi:hypothetical protein